MLRPGNDFQGTTGITHLVNTTPRITEPGDGDRAFRDDCERVQGRPGDAVDLLD